MDAQVRVPVTTGGSTEQMLHSLALNFDADCLIAAGRSQTETGETDEARRRTRAPGRRLAQCTASITGYA